ncbi:MAG: hypothetical protein GYB68_18235 [Chloroflexi bacterium]|nr:hypothetical protein [Chloroflexota bacterium]
MTEHYEDYPPQQSYNWHTPDGLLMALKRSADHNNPRDVTLLVKGMLITGTLCSQSEFVNDFAYLMNMDEGQRADLVQSMHDVEDNIAEYLHLKDVALVAPMTLRLTNQRFPYWRCRLNTVDAWTLGRTELGS